MPRENGNIRGNLKEDFFLVLLQPIICKVDSGGFQRTLSPDQNPVFQGDLYPHCAKDLPPGHNSFLGVCGPSESRVLHTESWASACSPKHFQQKETAAGKAGNILINGEEISLASNRQVFRVTHFTTHKMYKAEPTLTPHPR